jgi:hypothetical protein
VRSCLYLASVAVSGLTFYGLYTLVQHAPWIAGALALVLLLAMWSFVRGEW